MLNVWVLVLGPAHTTHKNTAHRILLKDSSKSADKIPIKSLRVSGKKSKTVNYVRRYSMLAGLPFLLIFNIPSFLCLDYALVHLRNVVSEIKGQTIETGLK